MNCLNLFFFFVSLLMSKTQIKQMQAERDKSQKCLLKDSPVPNTELSDELMQRRKSQNEKR